MTQQKGAYFEQLALQYLQQQGLQLVARNVSCRFGEIDLVMQLSQQVIFVEVKYRQSQLYGGPLAAVTTAKQQKLRLTASWYLQQLNRPSAARFDVIAISGAAPYQIDWLRNAF